MKYVKRIVFSALAIFVVPIIGAYLMLKDIWSGESDELKFSSIISELEDAFK